MPSPAAAACNLPFSLLDLTFAQVRQRVGCSSLSLSSAPRAASASARNTTNADANPLLFVRHAHAHAHAFAESDKTPDVREGYLRPLSEGERERDGVRALDRARRRPSNIARDVRRTETGRAPSYAALLLHDRVDDLVRRTGGGGSELYIPETQDAGAVQVGRELHYSDAELQELYTDLLAHPQSELEAQSHFSAKSKLAHVKEREEMEMEARKARREVLDGVKRRLVVEHDLETEMETGTGVEVEVDEVMGKVSLASRLSARRKTSSDSDTTLGAREEVKPQKDLLALLREQLNPEKLHHNILLRIADVVQSIEDARRIIGNPSATSNTTVVTVLSTSEWNTLIRTCVDESEIGLAENGLSLMKRCGLQPEEGLVNDVLNVHATQGDVPAVMSFFEKLAISKPTERQRDLHIKAHLKSSPSHDITSSLQVLHKYESLALLPPVKSYTRLICALFSQHSAQHRAQAWDLFSHMRYVAHAKPDPALYALMIRACAGTGTSQSGYVVDSVRALDLWTEMTTEAGYAPTVGAYNAVILACARSVDYVGEAFRLAREMLDGHRDAHGYPLMHATQETFDALLVAAKTRKDLPRARWILAEMLKMYEQSIRNGVDADVQPDGRTVMHVFHAYASYRPPFRRGDTAIVDVDKGDLEQYHQHSRQESGKDTLPASVKEIEKTSSTKAHFGVTPPQTRQELLAEADTLFERVLLETGLHPSSPAFDQSNSTDPDPNPNFNPDSNSDPTSSHPGPFSRVRLTPTLLNSYLSVHYMHDTIENLRKLYDGVFRRTGVERSPRTFVEALERCAHSEKDERPLAKSFAEAVWREWLGMEKRLDSKSSPDARMIERAYAAMIRMFALIGDLDSALSLLRDFTARYPPQSVAHPHPSQRNTEMRSSRVSLFAHRPLIRLITPSEVPDDTVPPLLTSRDLELLFQRLVVAGHRRRKDLNWLTYLANAYLGFLRKRRDRSLRT